MSGQKITDPLDLEKIQKVRRCGDTNGPGGRLTVMSQRRSRL